MTDDPNDTDAYEVGYGKPPKSGQFRKGQSGNPRGRPRGARGVKTVLDEALGKEITVSEGGQTSRITRREALIWSLISKALKGDKRSEMWLTCRDWLARGPLPDDDRLAAELSAPNYSYNAQNAIQLERKEYMKKRGLPSPDIADALALKFAYPVWGDDEDEEPDTAFDTGRSKVTGY